MVGLLGVLVRATGAMRVLQIGSGEGVSGLEIVTALPPAGMLIALERHVGSAQRAREVFAAAGVGRQTSVVIGEPTRFLHKVAGPFDLIHQNSDPLQYQTLHEGLLALLREGGTMVTQNTGVVQDYNRMLASDPRLTTASLDIGGGIAISVKRQDST